MCDFSASAHIDLMTPKDLQPFCAVFLSPPPLRAHRRIETLHRLFGEEGINRTLTKKRKDLSLFSLNYRTREFLNSPVFNRPFSEAAQPDRTSAHILLSIRLTGKVNKKMCAVSFSLDTDIAFRYPPSMSQTATAHRQYGAAPDLAGRCISTRREDLSVLLNDVAAWLGLWWSQAVIRSRAAWAPPQEQAAATIEADSLLATMTFVQKLHRERYAVERTTLRRHPPVRRPFWWENT